MNTLTQIVIVVVVGTALMTTQAQEPKTLLRQVEERIRPVLTDLTPGATIEYPEGTQSLVVHYRPQKFLLHGRSKTGEWSTNMFEDIGPSFTGFVLKVHLQRLGEVNQAVLPQTSQEPYWRTFLNATPIAGTTNQIYWALSSGVRTDEKVLASVRHALESLGGSETKTRPERGGSVNGNQPIPLKLPAPDYFSRPVDLTVPDPHVEPRSPSARPPFLAPVGVTNLAFHTTVTTSDTNMSPGTLSKITDGEKDPGDGNAVQLHTGKQWVQVDLEDVREIYAIVIWHRESEHPIFQCVVVQIADDATMTMNVHNLFNNDYANLLGLGAGADKQYVESNEGRLIDAKGIKGRYVRCYSKGSNQNRINYYTEIEVWGLPGQ